jgi:hypothetical protein
MLFANDKDYVERLLFKKIFFFVLFFLLTYIILALASKWLNNIIAILFIFALMFKANIFHIT